MDAHAFVLRVFPQANSDAFLFRRAAICIYETAALSLSLSSSFFTSLNEMKLHLADFSQLQEPESCVAF